MNMIDRKILSYLQKDGRQSLTELAEQVGISLSACHRRVKALEESGAIREYRAVLDPVVLGLEFSTMVFVTLEKGDQKAVSAFENALDGIVEIVDAQRLFGDPDYLLKVVTTSLASFQSLYDRQLSSLPNVQKLTTTLVMKTVIDNRPVTIR